MGDPTNMEKNNGGISMAEKFNFPSKENNVEIMNFLINSSKYLESNDMRVTEVYEGYAKVEMIIDENILNPSCVGIRRKK